MHFKKLSSHIADVSLLYVNEVVSGVDHYFEDDGIVVAVIYEADPLEALINIDVWDWGDNGWSGYHWSSWWNCRGGRWDRSHNLVLLLLLHVSMNREMEVSKSVPNEQRGMNDH